jgi:hypothetical protein
MSKNPAKRPDDDWDWKGECLHMVKESIEKRGVNMDGCPPMFYPEAIHNLFAWGIKGALACREAHGNRDQKHLIECVLAWMKKHQEEKGCGQGGKMPNVIEGFKVSVSSEELGGLLLARVKYHNERVVFFRSEAVKYRKEQDAVADNPYSNSTVKGIKGRIEESLRHHEDRAKRFKFIANHLMKGEYVLSGHDLTELELVARD